MEIGLICKLKNFGIFVMGNSWDFRIGSFMDFCKLEIFAILELQIFSTFLNWKLLKFFKPEI